MTEKYQSKKFTIIGRKEPYCRAGCRNTVCTRDIKVSVKAAGLEPRQIVT